MKKSATAKLTTGPATVTASGVRTVLGRATVEASRQCGRCAEWKPLEAFDEHSKVCRPCSEARG